MNELIPAVSSWQTIADYFALDTSQVFQTDMLLRYLIQVILLFGSAFFSGSETALFSLSHVDFQYLRQTRHRHAEKLQALLDEPRRLIVSILCGNELVNIAAVANMTGILVALYGEAKAGWIAVLVMFPLLLLVGEVTPKTIAVTNPRRISAGVVAGPLWRWVRLIGPIRWLVRIVSDRITTWIVGPQREPSNILQIDEFRSVIEDVVETGKLNVTARTLINNLLSAGATEIVKIMTPRTSTFFLNADAGVAEIIHRFSQERHSRVPVYRNHRDNLIGFLHDDDIVRLHLEGADYSKLAVEDIVRPPIVVPLTKTVDEMFDFFVKSKARAAAVLNEFGGVAGFITVNDVLRSIFGSLAHRTDAQQRIVQIGPNTYEAPGDTKLGELDRVTNFDLHDPRMTTIAGVAFRHIDRLPCIGDQVIVDGVAITVLEMDEHRIARVRVCRAETASEAPATGATQ